MDWTFGTILRDRNGDEHMLIAPEQLWWDDWQTIVIRTNDPTTAGHLLWAPQWLSYIEVDDGPGDNIWELTG